MTTQHALQTPCKHYTWDPAGCTKNALTKAQIYSQWFCETPRELCPQGRMSEVLLGESMIWYFSGADRASESRWCRESCSDQSILSWVTFSKHPFNACGLPLQPLFILRKWNSTGSFTFIIVVRTLKSSTLLTKMQVHNTVLLTTGTMLYSRF